MPIGHLLDQWEVYKQFNGLAKPKREHYINQVIQFGIGLPFGRSFVQ